MKRRILHNMSTISTHKLSGRDQDILTTLYRYRGMTALQVAQKIHNSLEPKNSQKSMVHNYLKRLKKGKIVASKKLEDYLGLGSIYYLTPTGFQITKDLLNIDIEQKGEGYLFADEIEGYHTHADLQYAIYKPPLEQIAHHLLLIDSLIKLDFLDIEENIDYRLSMYTTREYEQQHGHGKLRPDAEVLLPDNRNYFIEIDKGTEGYQQLYEKFINYRYYLSQLDIEDLPSGILFITDEKQQLFGLKRRWATILAAYMNAMGNLATKVNLILSPLNYLAEKILFEFNRPRYNNLATNKLNDFLRTQGYSPIQFITIKPDESLFLAIAEKNKQYKLVFTRVVNEFESSIFSCFFYFQQSLNNIHAMDRLSSLTSLGTEQVLFSKSNKLYLPKHFPKEKWLNTKICT